LTALEKSGPSSSAIVNAKKSDGDYYLADDEALMRLMQRLDQLGEPGL
jgi:hypothetical protein